MAYITVDSLRGIQYNSVRLIVGQSLDVNGSIQCAFIYLFTSLHNQTTCSHNTHTRRYAGNSNIVTTKYLLNDLGFPATNGLKSYFRAMVYIILHT